MVNHYLQEQAKPKSLTLVFLDKVIYGLFVENVELVSIDAVESGDGVDLVLRSGDGEKAQAFQGSVLPRKELC